MSEWRELKLGDISTIKGGKRLPKNSSLVDTKTNHPYIRTRDITNHKIVEGSLLFVPDEAFSKISQYTVDEGDLIISIVGTIGLCAIIPESLHKASLTENCAKIVNLNNEMVDKNYLYFYLTSNVGQEEVEIRNVGSTQPKLPLYNIKDISIPLPPLLEQKAIAGVLSSLDDKIDLLHRQNKTLEAMAETLFRQWFIEDTDGEEVSLTEIIEFNPKESITKFTEADYLEMSNVQSDSFSPIAWRKREFTSGTKFRNQDTLLARITPCLENGKACFVTFLKEGSVGWGSTEFIVMRALERFHPLISYAIAKNIAFRDFAESCLEGSSGRQRVNINHLTKFTVNYPSGETINSINELLKSIEPKLKSNFQQIQILKSIKDSLLPKLMNGDIKLCD